MQAVLHPSKPTKFNTRVTHLLVDIVLFVLFLVVMSPHISTIAVHEWLGIGLGMGIIVHLLLNWSWLVAVTQRFFGATAWSARINYLLNTVLFIDMTVIILSGLLISEAVLPLFGIESVRGGSWRMIHALSAEVLPFILGLHVALHWKWIVTTTKRMLWGRREPVLTVANATPTAIAPTRTAPTRTGGAL